MAQPPKRSGPTPQIDPESLYTQLGYLIANMPDLTGPGRLSPSTLQWMGKAYALVAAAGDGNDAARFKNASDRLNTDLVFPEPTVRDIHNVLYRALGLAELRAPMAARGAFIPAGNAFDAMIAVGKVLQTATTDALIVDPYMDEKALTDFAVQTPVAVTIRLLADTASHKPTLKPAATRWIAQYGAARPLEVKLASTRSLHDRLIAIDGAEAWTLTQSLNALAARSPASLVRVDAETGALKISAYEDMWQAAVPL